MARSLRLAVLADSFAYTDETGPQLPDSPHLYPNIAATALEEELGVRVRTTVLARPGIGVRDLWHDLTKDRHVQFDVVARADALVVGVGSFDHAPAGVPLALRSLIPYVRVAPVRRALREAVLVANPRIIRVTGGRMAATPTSEFRRLFDRCLHQLRGLATGVAAVALGPVGSDAAFYAHCNRHLDARERLQREIAAHHGFPTVPVRALVAAHEHARNPDGVHWHHGAHEDVGRAIAARLAEQLRGEVARPPSAWESVKTLAPRGAR